MKPEMAVIAAAAAAAAVAAVLIGRRRRAGAVIRSSVHLPDDATLHLECDGLTPVHTPPSIDQTPVGSPRRQLNRRLTTTTMDAKITAAEYAVRGTVSIKAGQIKAALARGDKLPFDHLTLCNIGNPHAVKQKPITFYRQVAAALYMPEIADRPQLLLESGLFPSDVVERAQAYFRATGANGVGAYTDSVGLQLVREEVARFIEERDGFPADPNDLALSAHAASRTRTDSPPCSAVALTRAHSRALVRTATGASEGVKRCISAIVSHPSTGIMIPRPQYPLYSAALTMAGGRAPPSRAHSARGSRCPFRALAAHHDAA